MLLEQLPPILGLDAAGNPLRWVTYKEAVNYEYEGSIAWKMGEMDVVLRGGTSRMTGKQSTIKINTIIAIKGRISPTQLERANRIPLSNHTLFQRDQKVCAYCGQRFKLDDLSRDHIVPVSKSGRNTWENCVTACGPCNRRKSNRTPEDAKMPLLYVPYAPNLAEVLILNGRKILADQMEFLLRKVPPCSRLL